MYIPGLSNLPYDKALHMIGGVILFAVGHYFFGWQVGLALAATIGALKEIYDKVSGTGTPDVMDFVATVAGGTLGLACTLSFK
jgi:hypothetical protein